MFFLLVLLDDRRIRIRGAQKDIDPTDPDPQHKSLELTFFYLNGDCQFVSMSFQ